MSQDSLSRISRLAKLDSEIEFRLKWRKDLLAQALIAPLENDDFHRLVVMNTELLHLNHARNQLAGAERLLG
jgi:hypothetical protein